MANSPRVLVLLPAGGYRAADFVAAARTLGVELVVASDEAQTLEMPDRAVVVDFDDPERSAAEIAAFARDHPLDGVIAADDRGVVTAALAGKRLGLHHNPPESAARTRDKAAMREALAVAAVAQPRYRVVAKGEDARDAAEEIGFPCVMKPLSLSASRGVIRVDEAAGVKGTAERIRGIVGDHEASLLVERYIPGNEVALEGLLRGGRLDVLAIFDKPDPLEGPYFEETIYVTPSRFPAEVLGTIEELAASAAAALGLREGPVHAELRVNGPKACVLELAARSIGGLCSRALHFGLLGASLEEVLIRHAVGLPLAGLHRERESSGVMMLPIPQAGTLREVRGQDEARSVEGVVGLEVTVAPGRNVLPLPEGDRYLGFLFAKARAPSLVEAALRRAYDCLNVVID